MHIPARFAEALSTHLAMNVATEPGLSVPLMLAIHGSMGSGKTVMCREMLSRMRVIPIPVFADAFESFKAGEPPEEVRERYMRAARINADIAAGEDVPSPIGGEATLAVVVVDDLDQRIGNDPGSDVQKTQNTQLINAALMELADSPQLVDGVPAYRTPIVVTANHLDWIYPPVVRTGRMETFHWEPTPEERAAILLDIFPHFTAAICGELITRFPHATISDFAATRYQLYRDAVAGAVRRLPPDRMIAAARDRDWTARVDAPALDFAAVAEVLGSIGETRIGWSA